MLTTGATLDGCARAPKPAAAAKLGALTRASGCQAGLAPYINGDMVKVVIYTTQFCPYCVQAKRLLTQKGVTFEEIDVSNDAELRRSMVEKAGGRMTVPQIFVDDNWIGDCDGIYALDRAGRLDSLLNPT